MTTDELIGIFNKKNKPTKYDSFNGLVLLSKYIKNPIIGAQQDIIYSVPVNSIVDKLSNEDAISLQRMGWDIYSFNKNSRKYEIQNFSCSTI